MIESETFSLFIEDFTHLDGAILHPSRGPIGISYSLGIEFVGSLLEDGTVFDFSTAKKIAKRVVDTTADHAFTVPKSVLKKINELESMIDLDDLFYQAPSQAFFVIDTATEHCLFATLETIIFAECKKRDDCAQLKQVKITAKEETEKTMPGSFFYHYTHGLKKTPSNCQRLIHGHRSTIKILINGVREPKYERVVADFYADKHLSFGENIKDKNEQMTTIEYVAGQGTFIARIPNASVIKYPFETTVENIAKFTAFWLKELFAKDLLYKTVTVFAFEGIEKGCSYSLRPGLGTIEDQQEAFNKPLAMQENADKVLLQG